MHLLVVNLNGIQKFVAAPVKSPVNIILCAGGDDVALYCELKDVI